MTSPVSTHCQVTQFAGMQEAILRLRNRNREAPETAVYLDWRYRTPEQCPDPLIFWLHAHGEPIGMAAAVFRPYQFRGTTLPVAVIGDIAVNSEWRGRGLGEALLRFMSEHLQRNHAGIPALVIPTPQAQRSLDRVGWRLSGQLVPLVCVLDPITYLSHRIRSRSLAKFAARAMRRYLDVLGARYLRPGASLEFSDALTEGIEALLATREPRPAIERLLSPSTVRWRYCDHPNTRFQFACVRAGGRTRAFLVFETRPDDAMLSIYDLVGESPDAVKELIAQFVRWALAVPGLRSLRMLISTGHPAGPLMRRMGFVARRPEGVFQVLDGGCAQSQVRWDLTRGDKDT